MSDWINRQEAHPNIDSWVILYRNKYPKFYWLGKFKNYHENGLNSESDEYTHWIEVERPPEAEHKKSSKDGLDFVQKNVI